MLLNRFTNRLTVSILLPLLAVTLGACSSGPKMPSTIRVATFNVGDLRTTDLRDAESVRSRSIAQVIREIDADILLLTNITHDIHGVAGATGADPEGSNATRLANVFIAVDDTNDGAAGTRYEAFMPPVNSGRASGRDLDKNGVITTGFPEPAISGTDGTPPASQPRGVAHALDSWGYGEFPGQRGFAILLRKSQSPEENRWDLADAAGGFQTFSQFQWASLPNADRPLATPGGREYYDFNTWQQIPLFHSGAVLFPVELPDHDRFWVLGFYAGPTDGDGVDLRSTKRRMAEARFVGDVLAAASYVEDDAFASVPREIREEPVILLADLGIDPAEPPVTFNPAVLLTQNSRFESLPAPTGRGPVSLRPTDTARDGGRLDFVLVDQLNAMRVVDGEVYRTPPAGVVAFPSPRFPVVVDVELPR